MEEIKYDKIVWSDHKTPLDAEHLGKLSQQIGDAINGVNVLNSELTQKINSNTSTSTSIQKTVDSQKDTINDLKVKVQPIPKACEDIKTLQTEVKQFQDKISSVSVDGRNVAISDKSYGGGKQFSSSNVEGALKECASKIDTVEENANSSIQSLRTSSQQSLSSAKKSLEQEIEKAKMPSFIKYNGTSWSNLAICKNAEALNNSIAIGFKTKSSAHGIGYTPQDFDLQQSVTEPTSMPIAIGDKCEVGGSHAFAFGKGCIVNGEGVSIGFSSSAGVKYVNGKYIPDSFSKPDSGGYGAVAIGLGCAAHGNQTAVGAYNLISKEAGYSNEKTGYSFVVGIGQFDINDNARRNGLAVKYSGEVYANGSYNSSGADYAEYFEWTDDNTQNEDRVGYFVTLDGMKIRKATDKDDYILGIVSSNPGIIGDSYDNEWKDRYKKDEWERPVYEKQMKQILNKNGEIVTKECNTLVENEEFDVNRLNTYESRNNRPEWEAIGMLGKLLVRDDGTCKVNGYCKPNAEGIATNSETGYRVMERINDHIVRVLFR